MKRLAVLLIALLVPFVLACSGGGSDDGGVDPRSSDGGILPGDSGGSSTLAASFTPAQASPGSNTVSMAETGSSGNTVTIDVQVTDTSNVHTLSFDVGFDADYVEFVSSGAGNLLEQDGNSPTYQVHQQAGRVVVGASRSGTTGTDAVGTRSAVRLTFRVLEAGASNLSIYNATLLDGSLSPMGGISWFAGDVVAN